jgi:hypothetical protein
VEFIDENSSAVKRGRLSCLDVPNVPSDAALVPPAPRARANHRRFFLASRTPIPAISSSAMNRMLRERRLNPHYSRNIAGYGMTTGSLREIILAPAEKRWTN